MKLLRLSLALLLTAAAQARASGTAERVQLADGLYARGMHAVAAREYEAVLEAEPEREDADVLWFRLGECLRHSDEVMAADKAYRRVFIDFPDSPYRHRAGFRRGSLFMRTGQYDTAAELFRAALEQNPPADVAASCLYYLGKAYTELEQYDRAVETFERLRKRHPKSDFFPYALLRLGDLFGRVDDLPAEQRDARLDRALACYRQVADKPPSDRTAAEALFQIASIHFRREAYDASAAAFGQLTKRYPNDQRSAESALQAAWAAHRAGLHAEALERARAALARDPLPRRDEWLYLKANAERQLLKYDDAIETYNRLRRDFPQGSYAGPAVYELALTCYKKGDFARAVEESASIRLRPEIRADVYWLLAESHAGLKNRDRATQYYRLLLKDFPDSDVAPDAAYRLGYLLQEAGRYTEAADAFAVVTRDFARHELAPRALFAAAFCLAEAGRHEEAARDWGALVRGHAKHELVAESLYRKGLSETRLERDRDALASFAELVRRFPESPFAAQAHFGSGVLLLRSGKLVDAEAAFRRALDRKPEPELAREIEINLAVTLQRANKHEEAARRFQALLASPARRRLPPPLIEWLSEYWFNRGVFPSALAAARSLTEHKDQPAWRQIGWCLAARVHRAQDRAAEAEKAYAEALTIGVVTPFAAEAALRLGEAALEAGRHEEALDRFRRAGRLASSEEAIGIRARAYAGLASAAKALSDLDTAARYFMSVAILFDDPELVPRCLYEAAEAFRGLDRPQQAAEALQELKQRYPDSEWAAKPPGADDS